MPLFSPQAGSGARDLVQPAKAAAIGIAGTREKNPGNPRMSKMIHCIYLKREAKALERIPWPGTLGQRIFEQVSEEGWQCWIHHQTMLINENRLSLIDPKARAFLATEMEKFFFGGGSKAPEGFTPPQE